MAAALAELLKGNAPEDRRAASRKRGNRGIVSTAGLSAFADGWRRRRSLPARGYDGHNNNGNHGNNTDGDGGAFSDVMDLPDVRGGFEGSAGDRFRKRG